MIFYRSLTMVLLKFSKISILLNSKDGTSIEIDVCEECHNEDGYVIDADKSLVLIFKTPSKGFKEGTEIQVSYIVLQLYKYFILDDNSSLLK